MCSELPRANVSFCGVRTVNHVELSWSGICNFDPHNCFSFALTLLFTR